MRAVILAGGYGTRLSEETFLTPKPMLEIGGKPILWHIMKIYSQSGINDFVICCGYKGYLIKEYFMNYTIHMSDITISHNRRDVEIHQNYSEPWRITLVDTGENTMTGGRLKKISKFLQKNEPFCFTYGDGVTNLDISKLINFHNSHGKKATMTAVNPPSRYGAIKLNNNDDVVLFKEKIKGASNWINGGFFVLSRDVIDLIDTDQTSWEEEPLTKLVAQNQLKAFKHLDFWQSMDTLRDKNYLNKLWDSGNAPWKTW